MPASIYLKRTKNVKLMIHEQSRTRFQDIWMRSKAKTYTIRHMKLNESQIFDRDSSLSIKRMNNIDLFWVLELFAVRTKPRNKKIKTRNMITETEQLFGSKVWNFTSALMSRNWKPFFFFGFSFLLPWSPQQADSFDKKRFPFLFFFF